MQNKHYRSVTCALTHERHNLQNDGRMNMERPAAGKA